MTVLLVHADAVLPGDGPPIRDGAVVLDERRAITDIGAAREILPRHAGAEARGRVRSYFRLRTTVGPFSSGLPELSLIHI